MSKMHSELRLYGCNLLDNFSPFCRYRKVEGDTCHGGEETYYEADQVSCPIAG